MKPLVIVVVLVALVGGGVFGAAKMGLVSIPGLSPVKKKPEAKKDEVKPAPKPKAKAKAPAPKRVPQVETTKMKVEPERGEKKLAKLWNSMEPPVLAKIVESWKDRELALVLSKMKTEKVAEIMALMPADRAAKLSREIQRLGSLVPPAPVAP